MHEQVAELDEDDIFNQAISFNSKARPNTVANKRAVRREVAKKT